MKAVKSALFLPTTALATLVAPTPNTAPIATAAVQDGYYAGTLCTDEGDYNCAQWAFQRCASGAWTPMQDVAPGTECYPLGISSNNSADPPVFSIAYAGAGAPPTASGDGGSTSTTLLLTSVSVTTTKLVTLTGSDGSATATVITVETGPVASSETAPAGTPGAGVSKPAASGALRLRDVTAWVIFGGVGIAGVWQLGF